MTHWERHLIIFITYFWGCDSLDSVDQNTRVQTAVEGKSVTINCSYETSDLSPYLFWYQQKMNGIPKYMMMIFATTVQNDKNFEDRFIVNHNKTSKSVPLTIQDVRVSDSAVYYCALRPTVTETHSTLTQNCHLVITSAMQKRATSTYSSNYFEKLF
uniref:T-cell receptor alpha/delta variable 30.0.1 n=3 Tax=Cyprinus carpio TaxID=7962 RepID=A0A9J8A5S1_CYPCA